MAIGYAHRSRRALLVVSNGYWLKLGHLRGDFNADGVIDSFDIDGFVAAVVADTGA